MAANSTRSAKKARADEAPRTAAMLLVAAAAASLCILGGGVSGPLAAWCLAPIAAAATLGGPRRMAEGAALTFLLACGVALAELFGLAPPPPTGIVGFGLSAGSMALVGVWLGSALIVHQRRGLARQGRRETQIARLREALDHLPSLVLTLSPDGQIEAVHGKAPEGIDADAGRSIAALATQADMPALADAVRQAQVEGVAEAGFAPSGATDRWICATFGQLPEGRYVAVLRDATDERDRAAWLDQARADAEQLAAGKARFLANMSHELRTPLNAIMGFADIMKARMFGPLPDKYAEYGALIHESGAHLLDLINDVLDMSKIEADKYELSRELFDGREAVNAALRLLRVQADGAGIQLRGVLPPQPLPIDADRRALKQIVLNLVSNALKFTPKGGSVTVTAHGYDGTFELVVADNGVGISKADLERIGRPYEQADAGRRTQGTGLGLSLVRAFAELHGGEMAIESELGEGATVSVRLPVLKAALPEAPRPAPETFGENVVAFAPPR
ncbi:MAG TPA: HAMP domain-containing sensor histidine kinase [Caulobacteraceae bacterium]